MNVLQRKTANKISHIVATLALVLSTVLTPFLSGATAAAATQTQLSTGADSACVVVNSAVKCWGNNDKGQLGTGIAGGTKTTPTAVYNKATSTPAQTSTSCWLFGCTTTVVTPEIPASAMANKKVTKVSVGAKHACALANASVFCWGDNSQGQLGRSGGNAVVPVAVDLSSSSSALRGKEVIDISASDNFSCALASDGSVACWGNNQYGQLGNGTNTASTVPTTVFATGDLNGKRGVRLAKVAGYSMCVLARAATDTSAASTGTPYCWGRGMGTGTVPAGSDTTLSTCSPVADVTGATTYFNSNKPVRIGGSVEFSLANGDTYMTGLGTDKNPYYWGMHGYVAQTTYSTGGKTGTSTNRSGTANNSRADAGTNNSKRDVALNTPEAGAFHNVIRLASASTDRAKQNNKPGGDKNRNLNSNNNSVQRATQTANSLNPGGVTNRSSGFTSTQSGGSWAGQASPGYNPPPSANVGNNNNSTNNRTTTPSNPSCTPTVYTVSNDYVEVGTITAKKPTTTTLTTSALTALSGNVVDNLFCGVKVAGGPYCDANGTSMNEGQTGSGYTQQCTNSSSTQVCGNISGPQAVVTTGWLSGKTIVSLSTGSNNLGTTGYTCAVANDNSVGCWGVNNVGQLGVGDTTKRNVPTKINL